MLYIIFIRYKTTKNKKTKLKSAPCFDAVSWLQTLLTVQFSCRLPRENHGRKLAEFWWRKKHTIQRPRCKSGTPRICWRSNAIMIAVEWTRCWLFKKLKLLRKKKPKLRLCRRQVSFFLSAHNRQPPFNERLNPTASISQFLSPGSTPTSMDGYGGYPSGYPPGAGPGYNEPYMQWWTFLFFYKSIRRNK